jgi:hypothetical protein
MTTNCYAVHPNGTVTKVDYVDYNTINEVVGGFFDAIPYPDSCGYSFFVSDTGLLDRLPRNPVAEELTGYSPIAGPMAVVEITEDTEPDLFPSVNTLERDVWTKRLEDRANIIPVRPPADPDPVSDEDIPPIKVMTWGGPDPEAN